MDKQGRDSATVEHDREYTRTTADVIKDIGAHFQQIVRSEIALARMELSEAGQRARSAAVILGGAGLLGIFALGFLLLAGMFALAIVLPLWLAALVISILSVLGASAAYASGRRRLKRIRPPKDTIQTVRENLKWIKEEPTL